MIFYKKNFPLGKGVRFSSYMKTLSEQNFSPYTLLIEEIPGTEDYRVEIVLTDLMGLWRVGPFMNGTLVRECKIQHSRGTREFTLQASIGTGNLIFALFFVLSALCFLLFMLVMIFKEGMSLGNIFVFLIITFVSLVPLIFTYTHDRNRLERIGSLGSESTKNRE